MNARDLIEAEDPKDFFVKHISLRGIIPRKLTPDEIERLSNIIASGPLTRRASDEKFFRWGYVQLYDEMPDTVEAKPGFAELFYNNPKIRGSIGDEWWDVLPSRQRGRIRTYRNEAEDPKAFMQQHAPPPRMASVESSHGRFAIDSVTGRVLDLLVQDQEDDDAQALAKIVRFDVDEWRKYWKWEGELPEGFDILDLGFWLEDGMYEPPEQDWRQTVAQYRNREGGVAQEQRHQSQKLTSAGATPAAATTVIMETL